MAVESLVGLALATTFLIGLAVYASSHHAEGKKQTDSRTKLSH